MSHAEPNDAELFDAIVAEKAAAERGDPPVEAPKESPTEPAPEAGSSVSEAETPETDDFDPSSLPPAVRARIEKYEKELEQERNARLAAVNRVAPAQRQVSEYQKRLRDLETQLAKPATAPPATNAAPVVGSPKWDAWAKNFPEEAEAILERDTKRDAELAELRQKVAQWEQTVTPKLGAVESLVQEHTKTRELAALNEAHPDWQAVVFPQSDDDALQLGNAVVSRTFGAWLSVQNPAVQSLFGSDYSQDNIDLLHMFKRDSALADLHQATPSPETEAAQRAHQRREQARATSVAPDLRGQSSAARVDTTQMSEAELFDHLMKQRARNR